MARSRVPSNSEAVDTSHNSSSHHSSSNTSNNIADAAAEQAARKRAGLCPQCGVVQTHTKKWGRRKPIQVCLWFMGGGGGSVYLESFVAAAVFDFSQIDHQWDLGYMDCACTCRLIGCAFIQEKVRCTTTLSGSLGKLWAGRGVQNIHADEDVWMLDREILLCISSTSSLHFSNKLLEHYSHVNSQNVPNRVYKGICLQCNSMAHAESNANREGILDEDQGACTSPVPDLQSGGTLSNTNHTLDNVEQSHPSDMLLSHGENGLAPIQQEKNVPCTGRSSSNQGEAWSDNDDANLGGYLIASKQRYGPAVDSFVVGGLSDDISVLTFDSKSDDDGGGSGGGGGNNNARLSTSLENIAEEGDSAIISGSQQKSYSQGGMNLRTLSNESADRSMKAGSLPVTSEIGVEECRIDQIPLLARKLEQADGGSVNRNDCNNSFTASAVSTPFGCGGNGLDARILEKKELNAAAGVNTPSLYQAPAHEMRSLMNEKAEQAMADEFKRDDGNTTPGAQCVNVDAQRTLLDRKFASMDVGSSGTSNSPSAAIDQSTTSVDADETMSESDSRSLLAHCSASSELINALKLSASVPEAATVQVLSKLRGCLLDAYGLTVSQENRGRSKIAFLTSAWAKTLTKVMSSHAGDPNIQYEVLLTLWTITALNPQYVSDFFKSSENMKQVISTMQSHIKDERIQEHGCGLVSCIASNQAYALRLLEIQNGQFIHRLMAALHFRGRQGKVQASALKALFRLSSASMSSGSALELLTNMMGQYVEGDSYVGGNSSKAIMAVISVMDRHHTYLPAQVEGNRLLWNILDPGCILDTDLICILAGRTLQHIEKAMISHRNSHIFRETAICLLSKMSCLGSDLIEPNLFLCIVRVVVDALKAEIMVAHSNAVIVALHGCRCLVNICSSSPTLLLSKPVVDVIPVILSCMKTWQYDFAVQSEACVALAAICKNEPTNKERVHRLDGVGIIMSAFDLNSTTPYEKRSVETKIRACLALAILAIDPIVMCDIQDKGIFSKLETLIEEDPTIPAELHHAIQDLLTLASDDETMGRNLVFQERASEEGTCDCLRANLRVVTSPDFTRNRITYLRSSALRAIERFPKSASVQEHGCKLLACLFDLASDNESFARVSSVELELSEEPDVSEEMRIITVSLVNHKNKPANAAAACSALQNFCVSLSLSSSGETPDLSDVLFSSLTEVIDALRLHHDDSETLEHVTGALWALCAVREELAQSPEVVYSIGLITATMNRFPQSVDLQRHGIGLLGLYFSLSTDKLDFVDDDLVYAIMNFIKEEINNDDSVKDGFDLIETAVNIIQIMADNGFEVVKTILQNENLIETIVGCMFKFPESLSIQGACSDILTNIAVDNYIRADVCHKGGTTRIISALENLKHDPIVVCKAFMALSNLIAVADVEILRAHDTPVVEIFLGAMKLHPQNLYIQVVATYALWGLAARHDSFKDEIVNKGGTEVVVASMEKFLGSKHMQVRGFIVIWSVATRRHLKKRIGRCAIEQLANGISAHISNETACEHAMGCLTCLSTTPVNKELLNAHGVADLIYFCKYNSCFLSKSCTL